MVESIRRMPICTPLLAVRLCQTTSLGNSRPRKNINKIRGRVFPESSPPFAILPMCFPDWRYRNWELGLQLAGVKTIAGKRANLTARQISNPPNQPPTFPSWISLGCVSRAPKWEFSQMDHPMLSVFGFQNLSEVPQ